MRRLSLPCYDLGDGGHWYVSWGQGFTAGDLDYDTFPDGDCGLDARYETIPRCVQDVMFNYEDNQGDAE